MATVQVTATSLNLHIGGSGSALVIGSLPHNTRLTVLPDSTTLWLHVTTQGENPARTGWVSAGYTQAVADPLPPADDATHKVTVSGQNALGPDGAVFAHAYKLGFYTYGSTSLQAWLDGGAATGGLSASALRTLRAVCQNEGKLEAVNSYDNAFISFGMVQWTLGQGAEAGELAALLTLLKADAPAVFQDCFGRYGLDLPAPATVTGYVSLAGKTLKTAAAKAPLRTAEWAYRFWRSGFSTDMRTAELKLAGSRFARFSALPALGHTVGQWMSSEHAMALMLDEHINRPGNVPKTLVTALTKLYPGGPPNPAGFSDQDEARLIAQYLLARAKTTMTDSDKRALAIAEACHRGELSTTRGSFKP
ncbi:MAG: SH3 domain-containing protein [Asticcacaulis sp.]